MNLSQSILVTFMVLALVCKVKCSILSDMIFGSIESIVANNLSNTSDLYTNHSYILKSDGYDDTKCRMELLEFLSGLKNMEYWAIRIADSWGKIPSGILSGTLYELGNFDQCLSIDTISHETSPIQTQYCLTIITLDRKFYDEFINSLLIPAKQLKMKDLPLNFGICVPNTCSPKFIKVITDDILSELNIPVKFSINSNMCQQDEPVEFSTLDIFSILFFSLIMILMVASTIYDVLMIRYKKNRHQALIAFSMYTNGKKIFQCNNSTKPSDEIDCLNGIRVLSLIWVIYGHCYLALQISPLINLIDCRKWLEELYSVIIIASFNVICTFFFLSGFLLTWYTLKQLDESKGRFSFLWLYLHRYMRLTPVLAATILFSVSILKRIGNGPLWPITMNSVLKPCQNYWWRAVLYIQNYDDITNVCLYHTWYLSADMQLLIVSPFLLYPLWKWRNKFIWLVVLLIVPSLVYIFTTFMIYDITLKYAEIVPSFRDKINKTYLPTYSRMTAWLIGIIFGYIMHYLRGKIVKIPMLLVITGWIIALGLLSATVFGLHPLQLLNTPVSSLESASFETFTRLVWPIALAWIIFACFYGYGGLINWFLSLPQWKPLARITYSMYLIHVQFFILRMALIRTQSYFSNFNMIEIFWGNLGLTIPFAIFWTMAFESPIINFEKIFIGIFKKDREATAEKNSISLN